MTRAKWRACNATARHSHSADAAKILQCQDFETAGHDAKVSATVHYLELSCAQKMLEASGHDALCEVPYAAFFKDIEGAP